MLHRKSRELQNLIIKQRSREFAAASLFLWQTGRGICLSIFLLNIILIIRLNHIYKDRNIKG